VGVSYIGCASFELQSPSAVGLSCPLAALALFSLATWVFITRVH
jgi:hypothetical protein